jgi:hypothetical protein
MRIFPFRSCAVFLARSPNRAACMLLTMAALIGSAGCGGVQEDRTIEWSGDGQSVGFQHGRDGVFIADRETGTLEQIFVPDEDVLATSAPLWSPDGTQMIFTTARAINGAPAGANDEDRHAAPSLAGDWDAHPDGRLFLQQPVEYTCWLREKSVEGAAPPPVALFTASCDHIGYVAANLAVRWHPQGDRIVHVQSVGPRQHGVFEFDLADKSSRKIFPHAAEALLFDWTPGGSHLVCVLGDANQPSDKHGIWIGSPQAAGADDWWQVPDSALAGKKYRTSILQDLRSLRPAWNPDGTRFAFVKERSADSRYQPDALTFSVNQGVLADRQVKTAYESSTAIRDLHWSPDSGRLGFIAECDGEQNSTDTSGMRIMESSVLHIVNLQDRHVQRLDSPPVRRFAGWNATGDRLAYVVADDLSWESDVPWTFDFGRPDDRFGDDRALSVRDESWALFFRRNSPARDAVYVSDGTGTNTGTRIFSGMRVTFPQWSPHKDRLSLWATFTPTHESLYSLLYGWGLQPGDPAAVLDVQTGRLDWMPINAHEKVQIGHYYLLKRDFAQALRWYDEAAGELPPTKPISASDFFMLGARPNTFAFFHYYCLKNLGRDAEAGERLAQFRTAYRPHLPGEQPADRRKAASGETAAQPAGADGIAWDAQSRELAKLIFGLSETLYMAEVYLSLDAVDDGEAFFTEMLADAKDDITRLCSAIAMGQLLLLRNRHVEYAELATDVIAPLLADYWGYGQAELAAQVGRQLSTPAILAGGLALLPMYTREFLAELPEHQLAAITPRWEVIREHSQHDLVHLGVDLFLHKAFQRQGFDMEAETVAERIRHNPYRAAPRLGDGTGELVEAARQMMDAAQQWRSMPR